MSRPLRLEYPGALWHVHVRGNEKRPIFFDDADRQRFVDLLAMSVERAAWILTAYVLMSNHFHLLIELTRETLSTGMKWLNGCYTQWFNARHDRVGHLFQGRFKAHLIEKETYFANVLRYIVLNPVRAQIVTDPEDYEWSSYRATAGICEPPPWLATDDALAQFADDRGAARAQYVTFVRDGIGAADNPWEELQGQIYLGSDGFIDRTRDRIALKPRAREHPMGQRIPQRPSMPAILAAVSETLSVAEERIRNGRGGLPRMLTAWIGCREALRTNAEIASALRLRSDSHVRRIVCDGEKELSASALLRNALDRCIATLRRKNRESQT